MTNGNETIILISVFKTTWQLKPLIIVGTRPEIIRLAAVINKGRSTYGCILAHTGQNYDYNLNGVFFHDLNLKIDVYLDAVGDDLGATIGNIINCSYKLMNQIKPDALLILGDTKQLPFLQYLQKRLHIPIFHMEAGNRCKDECLPEETNRRIVDIISDVNMAYSEHARRLSCRVRVA